MSRNNFYIISPQARLLSDSFANQRTVAYQSRTVFTGGQTLSSFSCTPYASRSRDLPQVFRLAYMAMFWNVFKGKEVDASHRGTSLFQQKLLRIKTNYTFFFFFLLQ